MVELLLWWTYTVFVQNNVVFSLHPNIRSEPAYHRNAWLVNYAGAMLEQYHKQNNSAHTITRQ